MDQTDGMNGYIWGVEAISHKIMAKHRLLRLKSDFRPISDEEVAFSRLNTPNHENHLHHDPPTDPKKGLNRSICGVEAISHKRTAENHIFADFSDFDALAADFVIS